MRHNSFSSRSIWATLYLRTSDNKTPKTLNPNFLFLSLTGKCFDSKKVLLFSQRLSLRCKNCSMHDFFPVESTLPSQKRNPVHSIALYWPDFQSPDLHSNIVIFKKTLTKSCSSIDTFWVQIDGLVKEESIWENIENTPFCLENGQNDYFIEHSNDKCSWHSRSIQTQKVPKEE